MDKQSGNAVTARIERETLGCSPDEFANAVAISIAALSEYDAHLVGVRLDAGNGNLAPDDRRVAFPGPEVPPTIMQAIRVVSHANGTHSFTADYELVGPSLETRKQRLALKVSETEAAELAKVTPPGKRRFFDLQEQAIRRSDGELMQAHVSSAAEPIGDTEAFLRSMRPAGETDFLAEQYSRRDREAAIQLWAAKQHHDIEDLTEQTINGWQPETISV